MKKKNSYWYRLLAVGLVWMLVGSLFLGVLPASGEKIPPNSDWIVTGVETINNTTIVLSGNLTIQSGGKLTLSNVTLIMNCTYNGTYHIEVQSGGELYIYNNSNITSSNPDYHYMFWVKDGSKLEMKDSELHECGWDNGNRGLYVSTDGVIIENCTISHCWEGIYFSLSSNSLIANCTIYSNDDHGVFLSSSSYNTIENCHIFSNNLHGICVASTSSNNTIQECNISSNEYYGIDVAHYSSNTTVSKCNVYSNNNYGIFIQYAENCIITDTQMWDNKGRNLQVWGNQKEHYNHTIPTSNLANGKPVYYFFDLKDTVIQNLDTYHITLAWCDNVTLMDNSMTYGDGIHLHYITNSTLNNCHILLIDLWGIYLHHSAHNIILNSKTSTNSGYGIKISSSMNNSILNCSTESNYYGILFYNSSDNTVKDCNISSNRHCVYLRNSSNNNSIYHNTFLSNDLSAYDECSNYWDYNGEGNYWDDFDEPSEGAYDNNTDGIVDIPYTIPGGSNADNYPLMDPWSIGPVHNLDKDTYYNTIQAGVDDADDENRIFVSAGTYYENVVINKTLTLIGEDRNTTIIDGGGSGDVVKITADWVNVSGFGVRNGDYSGIRLSSSSNNQITNCIAYNNAWYGLQLHSSSNNNVVTNCSVYNNSYGIELSLSSNNNIISCAVYNCSYDGIRLYYSSNNNITTSAVYNNTQYGIWLYNSSNNNITNCAVYNTSGTGVFLSISSNNNIITNCSVYNNVLGIYLFSSSYNIITNGAIYSNSYNGIELDYSSNNNYIYHNNLINNTHNAYDNCTNFWDNNYPSGGNYWSDYTGSDLYSGIGQNISGSDGIGDTPYNISGDSNQDRYPLMSPWTTGPVHNLDKDTYYNTIQAGVDDADNGNTLEIFPGRYNEEVLIKKVLTLIGKQRDNTIIDGGIRIFWSGCVVENLTLNGWMRIVGSNVRVANCTVQSTDWGLTLDGLGGVGDYNLIENCLIEYTWYGIYFMNNADYNVIRDCTIRNNGGAGINIMGGSRYNLFYHNTFIDNALHASESYHPNYWNESYPIGGNYWDSYMGVDICSGPNQDQPGTDGIGDTPYNISGGGQDKYPLMYPSINQNIIVNITYPLDNQTVNGTVIITGTAYDAYGNVTAVCVKIDNGDWELANGTTTWSFEWNTMMDTPGWHTIYARADGIYYSMIDSVNVYVDNPNQSPVANFSYAPPSPVVNRTVFFADCSYDYDGTIVSWYWDFSDGNASTEQNPTHCYTVIGNYTVTLTVTDNSNASNSCSKNISVSISVNATVLGYVYDSSTSDPIYDAYVKVTCDELKRAYWAHTDYNGYFELSLFPGYFYSLEVTKYEYEWYTETFIVGSGEVKWINVTLGYPFPPWYGYGWLKGYVYDNTTELAIVGAQVDVDLVYTPIRSPSIYTYTDETGYFEFYLSYGGYSVSATADNYYTSIYSEWPTVGPGGGETWVYMYLDPIINQPPTANFTYSPASPTTNDVIQFNDTSTDSDGTIVSWSWDFGDGNTSNEQNPTHQYSVAGNYSVGLTVTDDDGASDTKTVWVNVAWSYQGTLSGYVKDNITSNPISGAFVNVSYHETYQNIYTDENGYYYIDNIPICYCVKNVTVSKEGYITKTEWIGIAEGTWLNFTLEPIPIENQPPVVNITYPEDGQSVNGTVTISGSAYDPDSVGLTSHAPIYINGNANFTSENGVVSGSGTESDPYIIEGWDISASSASGIGIINTDKYFIIRNCVIHDGGGTYNGIWFLTVTNGKIQNITSYNNDYGIRLSSSSNNNLSANYVYYNYDGGIWLLSSSNNNLSANYVYYNYDGIKLWSSSNNNLSANYVYNNDCGICLSFSPNNEIHYNNIYSNMGYGVCSSTGDTVNATYNWWGSADGPSGVGPGNGDNVNNNVLYDPWLTEPVEIAKNKYRMITCGDSLGKKERNAVLNSTTVQFVEIKIDSGSWQLASGTTSWSFDWDTTAVSNGWHTIYAKAFDGIDYSEIKSVDVYVDNPVPIMDVTPSSIDLSIPQGGSDAVTITIRETSGLADLESVCLTAVQPEVSIPEVGWIDPSWFIFYPNYFIVPAGGEVNVTCSITIPEYVQACCPWLWDYVGLIEITTSNNGNMNVSVAIYVVDETPPSSDVDYIYPYWQTTLPFTITATASDDVLGSGVDSVTLRYRYSADNSNWSNWTDFEIDTLEPWSWSFTAPNGNGYYEFYSIAVDWQGNPEDVPSVADAVCGVNVTMPDTEKPRISNVQAIPQTQTAEEYAVNFVNISCTVTDNVTVNVVKVHIEFPDGTSPINATMTKLVGTDDYYYIFIYNTTWPITGTYYYYTWANDTSDNQNKSSTYWFEILPTPLPDLTLSSDDITFSNDNPVEGETIVINATIHNIGNATAKNVTIQFYDGNPETDGILIEEHLVLSWGAYEIGTVSVNWTASPAGEHAIYVVVDHDNLINESNETNNVASKNLTVQEAGNQPPDADFTYTPASPTDLDTVEFTDTSADPDGAIVSWYWDFDDGSTSATQNPSHQYHDDGTYTVTLTVVDDDGGTDTVSKEIVVLNVPPVAEFVFYQGVDVADGEEINVTLRVSGEKYRFVNLSVYEDDVEVGFISLERKPGAPETNYTLITINSSKIYNIIINYTADKKGGNPVWLDIDYNGIFYEEHMVFHETSTEEFNLSMILDGMIRSAKMVRFDASDSSDPDGWVVNYTLDFGDGCLGYGEVVVHIYDDYGTYTVVLSVMDDSGDVGEVSEDVDVLDAAGDYAACMGMLGVELDCPADLLITDKYLAVIDPGNSTIGYKDGVFVNNIPNASMILFGDVEIYFIPKDGDYWYRVSGNGDGSYVFSVFDPGEYGPGEYGPGEYGPGEYGPGEYAGKVYSVGSTVSNGSVDDLLVDDGVSVSLSEDKYYSLYIKYGDELFSLEDVHISGGVVHNYTVTDWSLLSSVDEPSVRLEMFNGSILEAVQELCSGLFGFDLLKPDLVIVNVAVLDPLKEAEVVSFSVEILNKAKVTPPSLAVARGVYVELWVDGEYVGNSSKISLIYSDSTKYASVQWRVKSGSHTLRFVVCAEDDINQGNNEYVMNVDIEGEKPLFVITPEVAAIAAGAGIGAGIVLFALIGTEIGKYKLFTILAPLYMKTRKDELLSQYTRGRVHGFIEANPGAHYSLIKRTLDLHNGTLAYHLDVLEKNGLVMRKKDGFRERFFPANKKIGEINYLSKSEEAVIDEIRAKPGISQKMLASRLRISQPLTSYYTTKMVDMGIITAVKEGKEIKYYLKKESDET